VLMVMDIHGWQGTSWNKLLQGTFKALGCARNIFKVASAAMNLLSSTITLLFFLCDMLAALSSFMPLLDYLIASTPHAFAMIATFPSLLLLLLHHFMPFLLASLPRTLTTPTPIIFARIKRYIHTVYSSPISSKSIPKYIYTKSN
jgi:SNF family Na+-dependent transporter